MSLYWRFGIWRAHQWAAYKVGWLRCWWRGQHEEVLTMGSITPLAWGDERDEGMPAAERWEGSYCVRCGKALAGNPFGGKR